jgi:hypothetical protein
LNPSTCLPWSKGEAKKKKKKKKKKKEERKKKKEEDEEKNCSVHTHWERDNVLQLKIRGHLRQEPRDGIDRLQTYRCKGSNAIAALCVVVAALVADVREKTICFDALIRQIARSIQIRIQIRIGIVGSNTTTALCVVALVADACEKTICFDALIRLIA